jgi:O-antigen/teichoic acid export membrane protein
MNGAGAKVIKNASILMTSQLITWALSLLLTIFLPRYLGAAAVGEFVLANSIWSIMGLLIGFGMDTLLTKEIARQPDRTPTLVGTSLALRGLLFLLSCGPVALYLHLMAYPSSTVYLIWIVGLSALVTQLYLASQAALQGLEAMHYTSLAGIVSKAINTGLGITVIILGYGIHTIGFVYVISATVSSILLLVFLTRYYKPQLSIRSEQARAMLKMSLPYMLSGLGLVLYGQVDVLIISALVDTKELGWYGAASQLYGTFMFIPVIMTAAVFPLLTRTYANAPDALPKMLRKSFDMMLMFAVAIGLGLCAIGSPIVELLFGPAFAQSGPILSLMGIVLIFMYQNVLIGQFLISTDRQNSWTVIMIIATAITIPIDLICVPWCQQTFGNGALAGPISFILTEFGMAAIGIYLLPKGSLGWSNLRSAARILVAGLVMFGAAWWTRDMFIVIPIIVGATTYVSLILLLKVISKEDISIFKQMAQTMIQKVRRGKTDHVVVTGA